MDWINTGRILGQYWVDIGWILIQYWVDIGWILSVGLSLVVNNRNTKETTSTNRLPCERLQERSGKNWSLFPQISIISTDIANMYFPIDK